MMKIMFLMAELTRMSTSESTAMTSSGSRKRRKNKGLQKAPDKYGASTIKAQN